MLDKVFVGQRVSKLDIGRAPDPVSRVTLVVDGENAYTAGDDTGRTIEKNVPWASQAMAESVLRLLRGRIAYRPFEGMDALLDPAAEIGDGTTVGGVYSTLAKANVIFDGLYTSDIAAPGGSEIEEEYPYKSRSQRQSERELSKIRSSIIKTAESITLRVENEIEGLSGQLKLTAQSLTAEINNTRDNLNSKLELTAENFQVQLNNTAQGLNSKLDLTAQNFQVQLNNTEQELSSQLDLTAQNFQVQINGLNSAYSQISQTVDSIGLGVYNGNESSMITLYKNGIAISSQEIKFTGAVTFNDLQGGSGTIIDGGAIDTNTLHLNSLYGEVIYLRDSYGVIAAEFGLQGAQSYYGQKLSISTGAVEIDANGGFIYLKSFYAYGQVATSMQLGDGRAQFAGDIIPEASQYSCGTSAHPWQNVYSSTGTVSISDRNKKKDVSYDLSAYDRFFDSLRPTSYRLKDGQSGRTHLGLIAQDVEKAMLENGLTDMDFAGLIRSPREGGGYDYALRYGEFMAMCIKRIQDLTAQVAELKRRIHA